jgi:acetyl-CoA acyltransferase
MNTLGLDPAKVNPMGGAIALGHPLGATGAIRAATVIHGLRRRQAKYGMVTMCALCLSHTFLKIIKFL